MRSKNELSGWRLKWYEIIFESDTPAGKLFDIALLICILLSVLVVMLESVPTIHEQWGAFLIGAEWFFTLIFSLEYIIRLFIVIEKRKYAFSFFGIIDLLSILPTYLALFVPGAQSLLVIRSFRLIRIFRILKLVRFVGEGQNLMYALRASRYKIIVFLVTICISVIVAGTLMFIIEGPEHEFTSIPRSIYWAIVTMTTVGYGDIAPQTPLGQTIASVIMILGYGIIAVPTGIVSAEMMQLKQSQKITSQVCPHCLKEGHDPDAVYCKYCGGILN
jgi:voltage-gated potassium channel